MYRKDSYRTNYGIERLKQGYNPTRYRDKPLRSYTRQWDYIICKTCIGCSKPLGRYDNLKGFAFCYHCRKILFPETVFYSRPFPKRYYHRP
jgi:hypothetical protein